MDNATPADIWRRGDYGLVGDWFQSASRSVLDTDAGPLLLDGRTVLDVAAGTGTVAIEAARQAATVVAYDITPELLTTAAK